MERVILSPHIDDAILSLGGSILRWLNKGDRIRVINVFSVSVSPFFWREKSTHSMAEETELRRSEERAVARNIGDIFEYLDYRSSACRGLKYLRPFLAASLQARLPRDRQAFIALTGTLHDLFSSSAASFYIPIAPPPVAHIDHIIVRDAALHALRILPDEMPIYLYEDLPYCARAKSFSSALEANGMSAHVNPISLEQKHKLVSMYKSQVRESWLHDMVLYCKEIKGERLWRAEAPLKANCLGNEFKK